MFDVKRMVWDKLCGDMVLVEKSRIMLVDIVMDKREKGVGKGGWVVGYVVFVEIRV